ncbi:MAG: hypothetical protein H8E41_10415 [Desulfobulbaceae bacterium]|uniref:Uncharacterized protein n=1 Tax=Candidatus Desulfobia pelagia TaxID=2841692 RepID=A0A8J6TG60_9BACT|nr:hypothetical protein [Candidatus Desulfobia pelagia]
MKKSSSQLSALTRFPGPNDLPRPFILLQHTLLSGQCHFDLLLETAGGTNPNARTLKGLQCIQKPLSEDNEIIWTTHGVHRRKWLILSNNGYKNSQGTFSSVDQGTFIIFKIDGFLCIRIQGSWLRGDYLMEVKRAGVHRWRKRIIKIHPA